MAKHFIYVTENLLNGKIYVGQKKGSLDGYYGSGLLLKRALKKYGRDNFEVVIIEAVSTFDEAKIRETYWIQQLNATDKAVGYNISPSWFGGDVLADHPDEKDIRRRQAQSNVGQRRSEETKRKLREHFRSEKNHHIGRYIPVEERDRLKTFLGRSHSEESKQKCRASNLKADAKNRQPKEYKFGPEFREKSRLNNLGKVVSQETREKLRKAQIGKSPGNRKAVYVDGIRYESIHEAAVKLGLCLSTLRNRLTSPNTAFATYFKEGSQKETEYRLKEKS